MDENQNEQMQMNAVQSPYSQTQKNMPSEKLLKTLEWWIAGLGWGNLLVALGMYAVMIVMFSDRETMNLMLQTGNTMVMFSNPVYLLLYVLSLLMGLAILVLSIIDIIQVNKVTQRITGLILFFILLRPGYLIWREHILGWKKTLGIINIIIFILYFIIAFVMVFYWMINLTAMMIPNQM